MADKIDEILERGTEEIIDQQSLLRKLRSKRKLRIKLGIDPTARQIHIGRAVVLWKLADLQQLGHKIILIVGDFTALIGDTSDKDAERPMLTAKQVKANMKDYVSQLGKILDLNKAEIKYNSEWLGKLGYLEIAEQAEQFSLHEFEARENIARRMKDGKRVGLREVLYPLMQGYDSVAVKADLEVGGSDQRFNLLAGRTMQKHYRQEPQDIMTFNLLEGTDGRKMSSSWGNVINISDPPAEMFGKTMSILDGLIIKYFILCTRVPMHQIKLIEESMARGTLNPRDAKVRLAEELVRIYHGQKAAEVALQNFDLVHRQKELPTDIPELKGIANKPLLEAVLKIDAGLSKTKAKNLIMQGGVRVDGESCKQFDAKVSKNSVVQVGKRKFGKAV